MSGASPEAPLRLVVLVSGEGTNLQAILDASEAGALDAEVVAVVSNRRAAGALRRAADADLSTVYAPFKPYRDAGRPREDYDRDLAELVAQLEPEVVVCAGWMHVLSSAFLDRFPGAVINLHPALPGAFAGTDAIARQFAAWRAGTLEVGGLMVHEVVPAVDAGPVLATAEVPFAPDDTLEAFEARVHAAEHRLLVEVLQALADARRPDLPAG